MFSNMYLDMLYNNMVVLFLTPARKLKLVLTPWVMTNEGLLFNRKRQCAQITNPISSVQVTLLSSTDVRRFYFLSPFFQQCLRGFLQHIVIAFPQKKRKQNLVVVVFFPTLEYFSK